MPKREPDRDRSDTLSRIAEYFRSAPPNRWHYLIAGTLASRSACHVITTNYDCGLEKALAELSNTRRRPVVEIRTFGVGLLGRNALAGENYILKIHGCSALDGPDELILTTRQEASLLSSNLLRQLPIWLEVDSSKGPPRGYRLPL